MAPPHKILKKLENNSSQSSTPISEKTCSKSACNKNKKSKQSNCLQSVISVKKSQDSGSSRLTKQSENSAARLITNLKPDNKKSNIKSKEISGGATSSKIDSASTSNSNNKKSTSSKSHITVLKAKEKTTSDISTICSVEDSKSTSSGEDTSSEEDNSSVSSSKSSESKMKEKKRKEAIKKAKRKRINAALENRRRRNLVNSVNVAIKEQKIFVINSQNPKLVPAIRSALKMRGWLEKCGFEVIPPGIHSRNSETTMKLLRDTPANFEWSSVGVDFSKVKSNIIVNKFPKNIHFTSKVGLCTFLQNFYWFYDPGLADTIVPRTFNIASEKDLFYVTQFYVLSACISLVKLVINNVNTANSNDLFKNGTVPSEAIDFAVLQIESYVNFREHNELDTLNLSRFQNKECSKFLSWFYEITQEKGTFSTMTFPVIHALYIMCKVALRKVLPFWDLAHLEGTKNLWIIKPANSNCGKGVYVMKRLKDIVEHVQLRSETQFGRYVIQKYIERPLLIFNTKFDIRQWFLVTSAYPLIIWMYSECYLRFSSQQFTLDDLHESIHLTNNSVQCNYTNGERNEELPQENMWHCESFRRYLNERGLLSKWDDTIYPGMCKGIIGAVLSSQNELIPRTKSFELYGADFMIGEDYTTILIEINSGPCMRYTTSVTKEMCKSCLEDIIKVVVDHKENPQADTGKFKELYRQEVGPKHNSYGVDLTIVGKKMKPIYKFI